MSAEDSIAARKQVVESRQDLELIELEEAVKRAELDEEIITQKIQSDEFQYECMLKQLDDSREEIKRLDDEDLAWEREKRQIHERLMNLRGNIRVFCRIRPCEEIQEEVVKVKSSSSSLSIVNKNQRRYNGFEVNAEEFKFDKVYAPTASQEEVFQEIELLVQSAVHEHKVCIFAYGQTGSGKSYTMEGPPEHKRDALFYQEHPERGIIPRAVRNIFAQMPELEEIGWIYTFKCSFFEIYMDKIYDLLDKSKTKPLKILADVVQGLTNFPVDSAEQVDALLIKAKKNRKVAATHANAHSSRSHFVFQLIIEGTNANGEKCRGSLNLIDLAGSENLDAAKDEKQRFEGQKIRESLSFLKTALMRLREDANANVSFRDSTLTRLLKSDLSAGSKVLMLVNVAPEISSLSETKNSLDFAKSVNSVKPASTK